MNAVSDRKTIFEYLLLRIKDVVTVGAARDEILADTSCSRTICAMLKSAEASAVRVCCILPTRWKDEGVRQMDRR